AGADDEDRLVAEVVEHLADIIDGRTRHRDMAAGDAGLRADAASNLARLLKEDIEQRPGRRLLAGLLVGRLDLPGDLPFTDDEAVETRRDAEQVPHRLALLVVVEVRTNLRGRLIVEAGEPVGEAVLV